VECGEEGEEGDDGCDFVEEEEGCYVRDGGGGEGGCVAVEETGDYLKLA
jgi:hypothetical protein